MLRRLVPFLALGSMAFTAATAADSAPAITPPPALTAPLKGGLSIVKQAEGPSGLTGYLMKDESGTYYTFWVTPDGKNMMAGALINEAGDNLTAQFQDKYEPKVDLSALWPKMEKTQPIQTGTAKAPKTVIYAFVDPNCPYCHLLWLAAKPYETAGLQIRWIETGFLHEDSLGKAAAIMASSDRVTTLNESQGNFQANAGIKPLSPVPAETAALLKENLNLMHAYGFKGVPGIVYKDAAGVIHTKDGMPKLSELAQIAGVALQPETDPALERFK
jgi:thiol:disulfide interchange protein DsbG